MKKDKGEMVSICRECQGPTRARTKNYLYKQCGLQNVVLEGITVHECESCGMEEPEIPTMAALHRAIMRELLKKPSLLVGEEIKFLRKMAGLESQEMARLIGVTSTQVSKWENNARPISPTSDRALRLICYTGVLERIVRSGVLNIRTWLKSIERLQSGPKKLRIDPKTLADNNLPETCCDLARVDPLASVQ